MKFLAIAVAILLLAQVVIGTVSRPLRLLKAESSEYKRIAAELKSLKKSNEKLERQLIYIRKPHGAAQEARKIGYVKPGEILLVLPPNATSFPKSTSPR
ncbi:MAG: septum formation initiator family protein [Armatimonadetes bacterium]|nr:septum formation initiator family protein [Armatimonadota bacterium]